MALAQEAMMRIVPEEKQHLKEESVLVPDHITLEEAKASFLDSDLLEFHFTEIAHEIGVATVEKLHDWAVEYLKGRKCYLIVKTEPGTRLTQEARDYASSEEFDEICFADAIIRADYNHEMAANFFIRFNRPGRPVRLFPDEEHAMSWIQGLRDGRSTE